MQRARRFGQERLLAEVAGWAARASEGQRVQERRPSVGQDQMVGTERAYRRRRRQLLCWMPAVETTRPRRGEGATVGPYLKSNWAVSRCRAFNNFAKSGGADGLKTPKSGINLGAVSQNGVTPCARSNSQSYSVSSFVVQVDGRLFTLQGSGWLLF